MGYLGLYGFERLIDLLGKVGQISGTHVADDRLFLIGQKKGLTKISACQRHLGLAEQFLAELAVDDRRRKQTMQARTV